MVVVILNLAVWFAIHTLFGSVGAAGVGPLDVPVPSIGTVEWRAVAIAVIALIAVFRFGVGMLPLLGGAAGLGILLTALWVLTAPLARRISHEA